MRLSPQITERHDRQRRPSVLLIERDVQEAQSIWELLELAEPASIQCAWTETIPGALRILDASTHDLLLVSPGVRDQQLLKGLDELSAKSPGLPILVLLAAQDTFLAQEIIRRGAQACLVRRQVGNRELLRTILSSLEQARSISRLQQALADLGERHLTQRRMLSTARRRLLERTRSAEGSSRLGWQILESSNGAHS